VRKKARDLLAKTRRYTWTFIAAIVILASAVAVAWYAYLPEAPRTEHGHVQR